MGIYNRDYMRGGGSRLKALGDWRATEILIAINVVAFIGLSLELFGTRIAQREYLYVSLENVLSGRIWTLVTYAFSHTAPMHLFFNMFVLWMFGRVLEDSWGPRRFIYFYLVAGIFAGVVHCALTPIAGGGPALGASGSVAGFLAAYACLYPRSTLLLLGIIPMPAWVLVAMVAGFDLIGLAQSISGSAAGGVRVAHGAHLGGSLIGLLYGFHLRGRIHLPFLSTGGGRRRSRRPQRRPESYSTGGASSRPAAGEEQRLDELLAKVQRGGLDSLTPDEREFMIDMSRKYRR